MISALMPQAHAITRTMKLDDGKLSMIIFHLLLYFYRSRMSSSPDNLLLHYIAAVTVDGKFLKVLYSSASRFIISIKAERAGEQPPPDGRRY